MAFGAVTGEYRAIVSAVPSAGTPRGLLFVSYQRSIQAGFEFLQHNWANDSDAPHDAAGADLVIGATGTDPETQTVRPGKQAIIGARVLFQSGKTDISEEGKVALAEIAKLIQGHRQIFIVKGHVSQDEPTGIPMADMSDERSPRRRG